MFDNSSRPLPAGLHGKPLVTFVTGHHRHLVLEGSRDSLHQVVNCMPEWKQLGGKREAYQVALSASRCLVTTAPAIANSVLMFEQHSDQFEVWPDWLDQSISSRLQQQVMVDRSSAVLEWMEAQPNPQVLSMSPKWTKEMQTAEKVLISYHVPLAPLRTNISTEAYRSVTFGGFTVRGVGITKVSKEQPAILRALHTTAGSRAGRIAEPCLAISLSSSAASWHWDNNWGWSALLAVGEFQGGAVRIQLLGGKRTQIYGIKRKWIRFDPRLPHAITPVEGLRLSLSFCTPRHPWKLRPFFQQLHQMGFPVEAFIAKFPEASGHRACPLEVFPVQTAGPAGSAQPGSLLPPRVAQKRPRQKEESTILDALKRTSEEVFKDWQQVPEGIRRALFKFHVELGHVSHVSMMRMLRRAGARPEIVRLVPLMPCGLCGACYKLDSHDQFELHKETTISITPLALMCCQCRIWMLAPTKCLTSSVWRLSEQMVTAFTQCWTVWAGCPNILQADLGEENLGRFPGLLQEHGVEVRQTPLESPWQQALVERCGTLWKQTFARVAQECSILGEVDVRLAAGLVTQIRNDMTRHGGYSPAAWVLGAMGPREPGSLLYDTERNRLEVQEACLDPRSAMERSLVIREAAKLEFTRLDISHSKSYLEEFLNQPC